MGFEQDSAGNFDIEQFAKNMLREIDTTRSKSSKEDKTPNESRLNTFFRLIGFPMLMKIDGANKIVTPGFDPVLGSDLENGDLTVLFSGEDLEYAKERENILIELEKNISTEENLDCIKNSLLYPIPIKPVVKEDEVKNIRTKRYEQARVKSLFPIITKHVEISEKGTCLLAKPFANSLNSKINSDVLKRPFLETVLKIRFILASGQETVNILNTPSFVNLKANVGDENFTRLKNLLSSTLTYNVLEEFVWLKISESLFSAAASFTAVLKQQEYLASHCADFEIVIKTDSALDVFGKKVSSSVSYAEGTKKYQEQKDCDEKIAIEEGKLQLFSYNGSSNSSSNALEGFFLDLLNNNLKSLKAEKNRLSEAVNKLTQGVEEIRVIVDSSTGEFIGVSLFDIIAVIAALFLIEREDLLALVDSSVREIIKNDARFSTQEIDAMDKNIAGDEIGAAKKAIENLQKAVSFVFDMLNIIINNNRDRSNREPI